MEYAIVTDYTVGFMFNLENRDQVILIEKNRPEWQKGLLNGIGGHIKENETARQGMVREFHEEAGVLTGEQDWQCFCRLSLTGTERHTMIYCFSAFETASFMYADTHEDETVSHYYVEDLRDQKTVPNLRWLIPLALYHTPKFPVHVIE